VLDGFFWIACSGLKGWLGRLFLVIHLVMLAEYPEGWGRAFKMCLRFF